MSGIFDTFSGSITGEVPTTLNTLNEIRWGKCSECGLATPDESNYCQNCGRKVVKHG